jgi:hypothetical protein
MNRVKNLSIPIITALTACVVVPANAQVELSVSTKSAFRHQRKNGNTLNFTGARFESRLSDGSFTELSPCASFEYYAPLPNIFLCNLGSNGFLQSAPITTPRYRLITSLTPGVVVAPYQADTLELVATPPSKIRLPLGGFRDNSTSLLYNLHNVPQEFIFADYSTARVYSKKQRAKLESEIVPGVYVYNAPRVGRPDEPFQIFPKIFPLVEGISKKNGKTSGFKFDIPEGSRWSKQGFLEISARSPITFNWSGITTSNVIGNTDDLFVSLKAIANTADPNSKVLNGVPTFGGLFGGETIIRNGSIYPSFSNTADPQILLATPFIRSFTLPPVLNSGTKGVLQVELRRALQTGGTTSDRSSRKFEIPVVVVDRYSDFRNALIGSKKSERGKLLNDADGDGFNNLTEWILESGPADSSSVPAAPVPRLVTTITSDSFFFLTSTRYFGFVIDKKLSTTPEVNYQLQRSRDKGVTWTDFNDGFYFEDGSYSPTLPFFITSQLAWTVRTDKFTSRGAPREEIQVISNAVNIEGEPTAPPGTANDIYRIKISRK